MYGRRERDWRLMLAQPLLIATRADLELRQPFDRRAVMEVNIASALADVGSCRAKGYPIG